eukprot:361775-Chlamydomonas_euryale.AAC.12
MRHVCQWRNGPAKRESTDRTTHCDRPHPACDNFSPIPEARPCMIAKRGKTLRLHLRQHPLAAPLPRAKAPDRRCTMALRCGVCAAEHRAWSSLGPLSLDV